MGIYTPYFNTIQAAMTGKKGNGRVYESFSGADGSIRKSFSTVELRAQIPDDSLLPGLEDISTEIGIVPNFNQTLGAHPDFEYLKGTDEIENHYIVSMFIDIKGSTNLFKKYDGEIVSTISNTIQKAAIHTCLVFGGYIHRLQGDGLFVYFGGKNIPAELAVERALQSASMFSYFVKNDLKNLFEEQGIDSIFTRIGIDLGHDENVVWCSAGIGEISEITTCSLHTSLAPKMQSNAESNGIVVGDHVKNSMESISKFFTAVYKRTNDENDRYIFRIPEKSFYYTQYDFNWLSFLKEQDFIATDLEGNLNVKSKKSITYNNRSIQNLTSIASANKPYFNFEKG